MSLFIFPASHLIASTFSFAPIFISIPWLISSLETGLLTIFTSSLEAGLYGLNLRLHPVHPPLGPVDPVLAGAREVVEEGGRARAEVVHEGQQPTALQAIDLMFEGNKVKKSGKYSKNLWNTVPR